MRALVIFATLLAVAFARPGSDEQLQRNVLKVIEYMSDAGATGGASASASVRSSPTSGSGTGNGLEYEYSKSFHLHEAPEEAPRNDQPQAIPKNKKHYNVIFVKAPTEGGSAGAQVFPQHEEKTIVYVLSKKNDPAAAQASLPKPISHKPDVVYVKYKNNEDSDRVVAKIQESFREGGSGYESAHAFAQDFQRRRFRIK